MARAIWSGSIGFGLVSIPIRLYTATKKRDVRFHEFQGGTGHRIRHKRVAEETEAEVQYEDVVKGYEVDKGEYVIVTPEELEAVKPEAMHTIEIRDFVTLREIDPIHFEKSYYVGPQEGTGAERPYAILLRAMQERGKVGIGSFVMREKSISPRSGRRRAPSSWRRCSSPTRSAGSTRSRTCRRTSTSTRSSSGSLSELIDSLSSTWEPERYRDTYRERVLELIERKAEGQDIVTEEPAKPGKVLDLMEALRASVEAAKQDRNAGTKRSGQERSGRKPAGRGKDDLARLSREELYERAQRLGIPGRSGMNKDELIAALKKAS